MRRIWLWITLTALIGIIMWPVLIDAQRRNSDLAGRQDSKPGDYQESHALVIGVGDYTNGWRKLPGVMNDVREVSGVLERMGFAVEQLVNPTRAEFKDMLDRFISRYGLRDRNRLLVYFAGHGYTVDLSDDRQLGYIVMRDAPLPEKNPSQFVLSAVSMDEINTYALAIRSRHAMFVFDSCFAGTIFRSDSNRRTPPGIASKSAQPVRQFITSGTAKQEVPDESIFRQYFVRAFEQREGDLNDDGYITGEELGQYLVGNVDSDTHGTQTPRYGKIRDVKLNIGDMVFKLPEKPVAVSLPAPEPVTPLLADRCTIAWDAVRSTENEETLEQFLKDCKDSPQSFAADLRLRDLHANRRSAVNPAPVTPLLAPVIPLPAGIPLSSLRSSKFTTATVDSKGRMTKREAGPGQYYFESVNGVPLEMVAILGGRFQMGSPVGEKGRESDEEQHEVRVSDFWIGRYEVTQGQWAAVMGTLPSQMTNLSADFKGNDLPVVNVNWNETHDFIKKLNDILKLDGEKGYRLPRESEWEYAARGGSSNPFSFGPTITPELSNYSWDYPYAGAPKKKSLGHPVKVGTFIANPFGIFDMHGNVWEWCEDWFDVYSMTELEDPKGPDTGSNRVIRGGGWFNFAVGCRSAYRNWGTPGNRGGNLGFRLVRTGR